MNALITGTMVAVSARLPSKACDGQREPGGIGQQAQGDLRFQPALFGEAGFAEPVTGVGFEVQRRDVEQHQRCGPQPGMCGTGRSQRLAPARLGVAAQPALDRRVGRRGRPDLAEHPFGVDLAARFDDPCQHQIAKHVVALGGRLESQNPIRRAQCFPQVRSSARTGSATRRAPGDRRSPKSSSVCPAANRSAAAAFSAANSTSSWADPRCSIDRDPCARTTRPAPRWPPTEVFTVRT